MGHLKISLKNRTWKSLGVHVLSCPLSCTIRCTSVLSIVEVAGYYLIMVDPLKAELPSTPNHVDINSLLRVDPIKSEIVKTNVRQNN